MFPQLRIRIFRITSIHGFSFFHGLPLTRSAIASTEYPHRRYLHSSYAHDREEPAGLWRLQPFSRLLLDITVYRTNISSVDAEFVHSKEAAFNFELIPRYNCLLRCVVNVAEICKLTVFYLDK